MNGISLTELAGVFTAIGVVMGGIFTYAKWQSEAQTKAHEGRISDLQRALEEVRKDCDERLAQMRTDFERQFTDMKQAMTHQSQVIERQEIMLGDCNRHIRVLEHMMVSAGMEPPDFQATPFNKRPS